MQDEHGEAQVAGEALPSAEGMGLAVEC